jgi:hypothetical protein
MFVKLIRTALPAVLLLTADPGFAPASAATSKTVTVSGNVATACTFNGSGNTATLNFSVTVAANGNTPNAPAAQTITNVFCNKAATLTVASKSLRLNPPQGSLNANQTQTINFTTTATGTGVSSANVTTAETTRLGSTTQYTGTGVTQSPIRSATTITVTPSALTAVTAGGNNPKLIQGTYTATVVVTLVAT